MNKLKRMWRSFHKNIIVKRKFKSYLQSMIDSEYRDQLNRLYELTKNSKTTEFRLVPVEKLVPGHKIIYPEYESMLCCNEHIPIEPIKVVEFTGKFVVVDGNHRLAAVKKRASRSNIGWAVCEVIV